MKNSSACNILLAAGLVFHLLGVSFSLNRFLFKLKKKSLLSMLGVHLAVFLRGETDFQQWHQENKTISQVLSLSEDGGVGSAGPHSPQPSPRQKQ